MEETSTNSNFELMSPSTGAQRLCKEWKFPIEKVGNKEIAEMYSEASVQNLQPYGFEEYTSVPADKRIKSIISKFKKKIRDRARLKSLQELNESMTSIFGILSGLEARLTKQINEAARNCNYRLKEMKWRLEEQLLQEIKLAMEHQGDMQRQQFKDLRSEILEIKNALQIMTRGKYKACACLSSEKECTKYSIEELKSEKNNSSKKQTDNKNERKSTQETEDYVRDEKYLKDVPAFHENLLQEMLSVHPNDKNEHYVLDIKNKIMSIQKGCEMGKPQTCKIVEKAMSHADCNGGAGILDQSLEEKLGNNVEKAMAHTYCNGGAGILDQPLEEKLRSNASPPEVTKENIFLKQNENFHRLPTHEKISGKCENLLNGRRQNDVEVSSKINNSNIFISHTVGKISNDNQYKEDVQCNRTGTHVSSSTRHHNRCNVAEVSHACEGINQLDKIILRDELGRVKELKDNLGYILSESSANKDKDLNLDKCEKQTPNMAVHTEALREKQSCVKKKRSKLDEEKVSGERKHYPFSKRVKSAAFSRRPPHQFRQSEVECLVASVEKFGTGRWRDIKEMYFSTFQFRTAADLKDKWRSLLHSAIGIADNENFRTTVPVTILKRVHSIHKKGHCNP